VPGALPLLAKAIETDAPPPAKPVRAELAREVLIVTRRRAWKAFARACAWLRVGAVFGFVCYFVAVGVFVYALASGPVRWPLAALYGVFAGAALYGAFARTLLFGAERACYSR